MEQLGYFNCKQQKPTLVNLSTKDIYCKDSKVGHRTKGKAETTGS